MLKRILVSLTIGCIFITTAFTYSNFSNNKYIDVYHRHLNPFAKKQVQCLAENIYYEAASEPQKGQIGVAFVTMNRVNSGLFPGNICDVVRQRTHQTCQFTWFCEKDLLTKRNEVVYNKIEELAMHFYANHERMKDPTKGALFYHADYVNPQWKNMIRTAVIGRHIFYNRKDLIS